MTNGTAFSRYIKQKRMDADLSQKDVAEKLGYSSPQFISNWERGLSTPPIKTVKKIAELYDVSIEEFSNLLLQDTLQQVTADFKKKFKKIM